MCQWCLSNLNMKKVVKKIAIVSGYGNAGGGVARAIIEMEQWFKKNDIDTQIYSYESPYVFQRTQNIDAKEIKHSTIKRVSNEINKKFDAVVFHSFPDKKYKPRSLKAFHKFLKHIKIKKISFTHRSTMHSINREAMIIPYLNEMDLIYVFGPNGYLGKYAEKFLKSKKIGKRIKKLILWFNFDEYDNFFNNPYEKRQRRVIYAGRYAGCKHTENVIDVCGDLHQLDNTIKQEMHGVVGTMAVKNKIFSNKYCIRKGKKDVVQEKGCVEVYRSYKRENILPIFSNSLFTISLFYVDKETSGRLEYSHMEAISCGCVLIADKEWADNYIMKDGVKCSDHKNCVLTVDKNNILEEDLKKIIEVANNKELFDEYRNNMFQLIKNEFDVNIVMSDILKDINKVTVDTKKHKSTREIIEYATKNKKYVDVYDKHKNRIVVLTPLQFKKKQFTVLSKTKQKIIKQFSS